MKINNANFPRVFKTEVGTKTIYILLLNYGVVLVPCGVYSGPFGS